MIKNLVRSILNRADIVRGEIHRSDVYGILYKSWGHVFTSHIRGDYLEFGVYKGFSLMDSYINFRNCREWLMGS